MPHICLPTKPRTPTTHSPKASSSRGSWMLHVQLATNHYRGTASELAPPLSTCFKVFPFNMMKVQGRWAGHSFVLYLQKHTMSLPLTSKPRLPYTKTSFDIPCLQCANCSHCHMVCSAGKQTCIFFLNMRCQDSLATSCNSFQPGVVTLPQTQHSVLLPILYKAYISFPNFILPACPVCCTPTTPFLSLCNHHSLC